MLEWYEWNDFIDPFMRSPWPAPPPLPEPEPEQQPSPPISDPALARVVRRR
jgi:hypothetical protein